MKWWVVFLLLFLFCLTGYIGGVLVYPWLGRTVIYPEESTLTQFPGMGVVTQQVGEKIFVLPKGIGRPIFDKSENIAKYSEQKYEVIPIPSQEQQLYSVGRVAGWEEIENTSDKYLLLDTGKEQVERYRILFAPIESFAKPDVINTMLAVEDVSIRWDRENKNTIENSTIGSMTEIGYEQAQKMIKRGDAVVLTSVFSPPELSKRDENGNYITALIVVRRIGGRGKLL